MTELTYGSDVAIEVLARLGIDHVAFNPGASYRGLHESLVHLQAQRAVLCLSEGVAVAVAHGYGKASGRPMGVFLHNLVGLQSGSMALFNAWIDQVPMVVLGGSGPVDRTRRRPWIDWIHTARPQGAVVRDFIKWDDEPASIPALVESLERAHRLATTAPHGPTYVAFDALLQEEPAPPVDLSGLDPRTGPAFTPPAADLERVAAALCGAAAPVILADRLGRSRVAYEALTELAELLACPVVDLEGRHNLPNTHALDGTAHRRTLLGRADVVLALDVRDLRWALGDADVVTRESTPLVAREAAVFSLGVNDLLHRGFLEREGTLGRPVAASIADTEVALPALVEACRALVTAPRVAPPRDLAGAVPSLRRERGEIDDDTLAAAVFGAVRDGPWQLAHGLMRGAVRRTWELDRWNCHLGGSGGAGLGYGVGATIGAAIAADGTDTLTVALQPEGDLLYTPAGLWTAARERLSMVCVVVNNRSYGQDRMHQSVMSRTRDRPAAHIPVGIDLDDPTIDVAALAAAQGVESFGPVTDAAELDTVLARAAHSAREHHHPVVVDVHVER